MFERLQGVKGFCAQAVECRGRYVVVGLCIIGPLCRQNVRTATGRNEFGALAVECRGGVQRLQGVMVGLCFFGPIYRQNVRTATGRKGFWCSNRRMPL